MSDTPIHIGELLPAVAMSLDLERAADRKIRVDSSKYAVLENNLTRKGIWATDGGRRPKLTETVHQEVLTFETEDIVGRLVMESSLGQLTVFEMELVTRPMICLEGCAQLLLISGKIESPQYWLPL